jgi:hypothetical protein
MVALSESVQKDLALWQQFRIGPESFIFASRSWNADQIRESLAAVYPPALREDRFEMGRLQGDATNQLNAAAGADAKVSADNRSHGLGVAMEEYTHSTPSRSRKPSECSKKWVH